MYTTSLLSSLALLIAATRAATISASASQTITFGSNSNGVATYDGYVCTGAIYVGCQNNIKDAFCCVGAYAQQNICNYAQPTTCSQGSYVPLTAASTVHPTGATSGSPASNSAQPTSASNSVSAASTSMSTGSSAGAAPTTGMQIGAGILAVVAQAVLL